MLITAYITGYLLIGIIIAAFLMIGKTVSDKRQGNDDYLFEDPSRTGRTFLLFTTVWPVLILIILFTGLATLIGRTIQWVVKDVF